MKFEEILILLFVLCASILFLARKIKTSSRNTKQKQKNLTIIDRKRDINETDDQEILADIAKTSKHSEVGKKAVERIDDQKILVDIAKNAMIYGVSKTAMDKLDDQKVLADIAKNNTKPLIRQLAVEKLDDPKVLIDIVRTEKTESVCMAAIRKIENDRVLADIFKHVTIGVTEIESRLRIEDAIRNKVKDTNLLRREESQYVMDSKSRARARFAEYEQKIKTIAKLKDQNKLKDIIKNESDSDIRRAALYRITDENILREIGTDGSLDKFTRKAAIDWLYKLRRG